MKCLVVDDHALIRDAMRSVLNTLREDATILEAGSSHTAMALIDEHPDLELIMLDLRLPDRDGLDVLAEVRSRYPAVTVVMLSAFTDRENVLRALDGGAQGFIPKTDTRDVLIGALRLVLAGGVYIPPEILGRSAAPAPQSPRIDDTAQRPTPAQLGLTERQVDVLALIMEGKSNKLICRALNLAEPTVKNHVSAILKALEVSNRTEAVLAVAALGWELRKSGR